LFFLFLCIGMPYQIPADFYYEHFVTKVAYTHRPQNKLDINRLIRLELCWEANQTEIALKPQKDLERLICKNV